MLTLLFLIFYLKETNNYPKLIELVKKLDLKVATTQYLCNRLVEEGLSWYRENGDDFFPFISLDGQPVGSGFEIVEQALSAP